MSTLTADRTRRTCFNGADRRWARQLGISTVVIRDGGGPVHHRLQHLPAQGRSARDARSDQRDCEQGLRRRRPPSYLISPPALTRAVRKHSPKHGGADVACIQLRLKGFDDSPGHRNCARGAGSRCCFHHERPGRSCRRPAGTTHPMQMPGDRLATTPSSGLPARRRANSLKPETPGRMLAFGAFFIHDQADHDPGRHEYSVLVAGNDDRAVRRHRRHHGRKLRQCDRCGRRFLGRRRRCLEL